MEGRADAMEHADSYPEDLGAERRDQYASVEPAGRVGKVIIPTALDALSHGNVPVGSGSLVGGETLLPLPCGTCLILGRDGRVVGSGRPGGGEANTCSRANRDEQAAIQDAFREAAKEFDGMQRTINGLETRLADMETSYRKLVQTARDKLVAAVDERLSRSRVKVRVEVCREINKSYDKLYYEFGKRLQSHREVYHPSVFDKGSRTDVGNVASVDPDQTSLLG